MKSSALMLLLILSLTSCKTSSSTSPTGEDSGSLAGKVILVDTNGLYPPPYAGVAVQADGYDRTALTKEDGTWQLDGVPEGTHVLTYSKPGYGTMKQFNVLVPGAGLQHLPDIFSIGQIPTIKLEIDSIAATLNTSDNSLNIFFYSLRGSAIPPYVQLEIRKAPFPFDDSTVIFGMPPTALTFRHGGFIPVYTQSLQVRGYHRGEIAFVTVAGYVNSQYYDYDLGKNVYPCFGPRSNTVAVTIP